MPSNSTISPLPLFTEDHTLMAIAAWDSDLAESVATAELLDHANSPNASWVSVLAGYTATANGSEPAGSADTAVTLGPASAATTVLRISLALSTTTARTLDRDSDVITAKLAALTRRSTAVACPNPIPIPVTTCHSGLAFPTDTALGVNSAESSDTAPLNSPGHASDTACSFGRCYISNAANCSALASNNNTAIDSEPTEKSVTASPSG